MDIDQGFVEEGFVRPCHHAVLGLQVSPFTCLTYELLNLRAIRISIMYTNQIIKCMDRYFD